MENTQQDMINKCVSEQTMMVMREIFETSNKDKLSLKEIAKEINNLFNVNINGKDTKKTTTKGTKSTVVRTKKELLDEDRCMASKKDGTRCNSKRYLKGNDPRICSLHNNNGMNFGLYKENTDSDSESSTDEEDEEDTQKEHVTKTKKRSSTELDIQKPIRCTYVFSRGKNSGNRCNSLTVKNTDLCKSHSPKKQVIPVNNCENEDNNNADIQEDAPKKTKGKIFSKIEKQMINEYSNSEPGCSITYEAELFGEDSDNDDLITDEY